MFNRNRINRPLQYGDKGKSRRPNRLRMGWMFPLLAAFSVLTTVHLQRIFRDNRGVSEIERESHAASLPIISTSRHDMLDEAIYKRSMRELAGNDRGLTTSEASAIRERASQKKALKAGPIDVTQDTKVESKASKMNSQEPEVGKTRPAISDMNVVSQLNGNFQLVQRNTSANSHNKTGKDLGSGTMSLGALDPRASFSACLLIRDDNDILNEWIAYHYHVLRLRRMIIAVDPNSETSPSLLLENWKNQIEIDLWTDDMYMPKDFLQTGLPPVDEMKNITKFKGVTYEEMLSINSHRYRQRVFLTKCLEKIKKEERTWVIHIDTDEYVLPNKLLRQAKPDDVAIEPIEEPGSVLHLLQQLVNSNSSLVKYPCITMLRLLFGSLESKDDEWPVSLPAEFDRRKFETLRWRYHGPFRDRKNGYNGYPKILIDISKVPMRYLTRQIVYSIHRPFQNLCRGNGESDFYSFRKFPIAINHYLGSWERYNGRNDTRRNRNVYNEKASVNDGQDTFVGEWVKGFIKDVGHEQAARLLGQQYLKLSDAVTS